jgi:hypothetical protein
MAGAAALAGAGEEVAADPLGCGNCVHATYPAAAISTIAATAIRPFLLPPLADLVPLSTAPPKVNIVASEAVSSTAGFPALVAPFSTETCGSETAEDLSVALVVASRAGAAALAAPEEDATEGPVFIAGISASLRVISGLASGTPIGTTFGVVAGLEAAFADSFASPDSMTPLEAEAEKLDCGGVLCAGNGVTGTTGREEATLGTSVGLAGVGAVVGGLGVAVAAAPAGLALSFFRNSPRATRSVPFACSTLMGLVRTRFAPIRKAFATPACPSTTATAKADWLFGELRALLNSNVAFCSLSQSTTTASKCSLINFFTAANGSVQGTTSKSNSLRTCITVRAVFSSGQKRSAW